LGGHRLGLTEEEADIAQGYLYNDRLFQHTQDHVLRKQFES